MGTFRRPFWITPHARDQFRRRFGPCDDATMEQLLNIQLQPPEIPDAAKFRNDSRGPALLYAILVGDVQATAVVTAPPEVDITQLPRNPNTWPVIVTVYPGRKHIAQYRRYLQHRAARQAKPFQRTWEPWEIETARLMRWIGYTMREIGVLLGRTEKQVERQICNRRIGVIMPRWTEEELQVACDMRFAGKTYAEIARRLGKSEQAVKHKLMRHRKWVLSNPERAAFLRVVYLLKHPERLLRFMRRTDMVHRMAALYGEEDLEAC